MCVKLRVLVAEEHKNRERRKVRNREKRVGNSQFLDGFKPEKEWFLRDRDSTKLNGKFYKLSNVFNRLKIDLETEIGYVSREREI